jgi:hypothetical protein
MTGAGFPHSDVHGSKLGRQLPVAYRSLPRPSSASGAKASTVGSLYLEFQMLVLAMEFSRVFRRGKAAPWKRNRNSPTYSREPSVGTPDNCSGTQPTQDARVCQLISDRREITIRDGNMPSKIICDSLERR